MKIVYGNDDILDFYLVRPSIWDSLEKAIQASDKPWPFSVMDAVDKVNAEGTGPQEPDEHG